MNKMDYILIALILLVLFPQSSLAQYTLPEQEIYEQKTIDKKSGSLRSCLTGNFEKRGESRYFLKESGEGYYGKFEDVLWTLESETELRDDLLCPLYTIFTVKDKDGNELTTCKIIYDYENELIRIDQRDTGKTKTEQSALPLKTRTTDYATMIFFLRPFMEELMAGKTVYFNFLSCEPGLYHLKARITKEELLKLGSKNIQTFQIEVTPDMGPLNIIVDKLVPPTLLWYGQSGSYPWLKYEGLESGRKSAHIITTVEKISPLKTQSHHE